MVAPNGAIVPLHLYSNYEDKSGYVARREISEESRDEERTEFAGLEFPGAMLPVGIGLIAFWGFLIWRAWGNPHARLFWKGGSLLTFPDLFYRNIILGSQVLLAVPVVCVAWIYGEGRSWATTSSGALFGGAVLSLAALAGGMIKPLVRRGVGGLLRGRPLASDSGVLSNVPREHPRRF